MIPDFSDICLLVLDTQDKIANALPKTIRDKTVNHCAQLIDLINELGGLVVYTEQLPHDLGSVVEELQEKLSDAQRVEKATFSCLSDPLFLEQVLPTLPDTLIVIGLESHISVLQTVLDLVADAVAEDLERFIYVPVDAIASRDKLQWSNALDQLVEIDVHLTNTETLIFQALGESGTEIVERYLALLDQG